MFVRENGVPCETVEEGPTSSIVSAFHMISWVASWRAYRSETLKNLPCCCIALSISRQVIIVEEEDHGMTAKLQKVDKDNFYCAAFRTCLSSFRVIFASRNRPRSIQEVEISVLTVH